MSSDPPLTRTLRPGETVSLGRKASADLSFNRPYLSSVHCVLDVRACPVGGYSCGLTDHSRNGTWLFQRSGKVVKVAQGVRCEVGVGEEVWLLSPQHKHCSELRFVLEGGAKDGVFVLRQVPPTKILPGRKRLIELSVPASKVQRLGGDDGIASPAVSDVGTSDSPTHRHTVTPSHPHTTSTPTPSLITKEVSISATSPIVRKTSPSAHSTSSPTHKAPSTLSPTRKAPSTHSTSSPTRKALSLSTHSTSSPTHKAPSPSTHSTSSPAHKGPSTHSTPPPTRDAPSTRSTPSPTRKAPSPSPDTDSECDVETTELEHCPHCLELFPLNQLLTHIDLCCQPHPHRHASLGQCPVCCEMFPVIDLVDHVDSCCGGKEEEVVKVGGIPSSVLELPLLEPFEEKGRGPPTHPREGGVCATGDSETDGPAATSSEGKCLKPLAESEPKDYTHPPITAESSRGEQEHCQHCLEVFPLSQLVTHSLSCPYRRDLGSLDSEGCVEGSEDVWGEPVERCMHCFRDFPLSRLVDHSRKCEGDMLGPRGRFTVFLPSVHDMDPMALSVLNETQMAAVEYVMERSKVESEHVYPTLKRKVQALGYTEKDLETTLQWVRGDAPIIVHINLDRVLRFLVSDTHYRNLFEVGTGGGSLDTGARGSWEDRIFNRLYSSSPPVDRVKYGVLNIVGDPRGVQSCYHYGDSFIQLKKVRLRTTFASTDTSAHRVLLSCCEYYSNVLNEYSYPELEAILKVATKKEPFLRSNVISQYKEVQIHGPLCLSENVDCIVVNERHASDTPTRELLDQFVERNKCNLLWMDPPDSVGYPPFTPTHITPSHIPIITPSLFPASTMPAPAWTLTPHRGRRHRRRRHRHRDDEY